MNRTFFRLSLITLGVCAASAHGGAQTPIQSTGIGLRTDGTCVLHAPMVLRVDHAAAGLENGRNWKDAFISLHDALAAAQQGDQIWVAEGTYYTADPGGSQADTFTIPDGVMVFGGFSGIETRLGQRDPALHRTALSADINRDDDTTGNFDIVTANGWNVVTMIGVESKTRLDGFDIETGHLQGATAPRSFGAGVHLNNSSPVIANCKFSFCVAQQGGAIYSDTGNPTIEACTFTSNYSSGYISQGAAIYNGTGDMLITDSFFAGNRAEAPGGTAHGGAIYNSTGSILVEGCRFQGNIALPRGGAGPVARGGAVYVNGGLVRLTNSYFLSNLANIGGAVATGDLVAASCEVYNSQFLGNDAVTTMLTPLTSAGGTSGAIYGGVNSIVDIVGCLVTGGTADNYGGAFVGGSGYVSSSIFWGNTDGRGNIGVSQIKASRVRYSCVMNMLVGEPGEDPPDPAKFPNSISLDPQFVTTPAGPYHLAPTSPCIDAADNTAWPLFLTTDFDGNPRFVDDVLIPDTGVGPAPVADMGPFEVQ
ncbi:MAG: right-handed parallel beta-helix repeat-containing protein [Planctomycetes bacterium]|nr:right-handed parallel beta-helix repeat-containing protein [Planctomycetota bacterium]